MLSYILGMNSIYLQLLAHTSLASAIPVVDNVPGKFIMGPEEVVTDFAVLTMGNNLGNLPKDFTGIESIREAYISQKR